VSIETILERIAAALEVVAASLTTSARPQLDAETVMVRPATQTIAPVGMDMAGMFAPRAGVPPYAVEAKKLAEDPHFQIWAAKMAMVTQDSIPDAVAFSLERICHWSMATGPESFDDKEVIARFLSMKRSFDTRDG